MSNLSDRGTLRGALSVGSESGGTDNYNNLINKPSINSHELVGDQSGDDLGLINNDDLTFNVGHAGSILHNIKYKNNTYTTYAEPYKGASSGSNGTMGLVPAPLASQGDYDKFLKGNGRWASVIRPINYSLEEQDTGIKWVDGKSIYQKTIYIASVPSGDHNYPHDISNLDSVIKLFGFCKFQSNTNLPLPYYPVSGNTYGITLGNVTTSLFKIQCGGSMSITDVYVTIQYTKLA